MGVDKKIFGPHWPSLPFTLLDKFFIIPRSSTDILSNRVNPLPRWAGGESFGVILFVNPLLIGAALLIANQRTVVVIGFKKGFVLPDGDKTVFIE